MKKHIKKVMSAILVLIVVLVSGCTTNSGANKQKATTTKNVSKRDAYAKLDSKTISTMHTAAEIDGDPSNEEEIFAKSSDVAIVTVESIIGGDNINQTTKEYIYPFTYGTMSVQSVYKGTLQIGATIGYVRMGGIVPFQSYYNSLLPEQQSKLDHNMGDKKPESIDMMFEDDIKIEVGKTYLVYMTSYEHYAIENLPVYSIGGWQGGLREVQGNSNAKTEVTVYNNYTKTWDAIHDVLPATEQ